MRKLVVPTLPPVPPRVRLVGRGLVWWLRWLATSWRWALLCGLVALVVWLGLTSAHRDPSTALVVLVVVWMLPGLFGAVWAVGWPVSYERLVAGPWRRHGWRRLIRTRWVQLCADAGLADRQTVRTPGKPVRELVRVPMLRSVKAAGTTVTVTMRARPGQTLVELETGADRIAATVDVAAVRAWPQAGSTATLVVELVMLDVLAAPVAAPGIEPRAVVDAVTLGRTQSGGPWQLRLTGRHTLVVGASGSGKGSVLWGIACGLAPAVRCDLVRLWGIDLKAGLELKIAGPLFSVLGSTHIEAVAVLERLLAVMEARGRTMAGESRSHVPVVGDPLHVLVIDELAELIAYAPADTRKVAERLLASILTRGRALGVVVVSFVQDPRKETLGFRGLYTQTVALRLRSGAEVSMTLGDGMANRAPAHRISPDAQGMGWIVEDSGAVDRVRADYWPDDLIRQVADRYPALVRLELDQAQESSELDSYPSASADSDPTPGAGSEAVGPAELTDGGPASYAAVTGTAPGSVDTTAGRSRPRKPRSPRKPRGERVA